MKIKEMCEQERPREKMLSSGARNLSDAEILSLILRNGTPQHNVIELSNLVLARCDGGLSALAQMDYPQLSEIPGIGPCKAMELMAAIELGRRFMSESTTRPKVKVVNAGVVFKIMHPLMKSLSHEEGWVLMLSSSMRLIGKRRFSAGTFSAAAANVGDIMRIVTSAKAASIILVHNHPGGDPSPSRADVKFTGDLHTAAGAFGITLADHVIVADTAYYSFADEKKYLVQEASKPPEEEINPVQETSKPPDEKRDFISRNSLPELSPGGSRPG